MTEQIKKYAEEHKQEMLALLAALCAIPAPSHHEEKRAAFILNWLRNQGAKDVSIDEAKNVICFLPAELTS